MSTRNLDALFSPQRIALIGASRREGSVGAVLARNLLEGGFQGAVMPVHPDADAIGSTFAYRSVADLPAAPDLAVIATPPPTVPGLIAELAGRGCRAAVVISAGFGEAGGDGADLKQAMLDAARPHLLRIVGPNCLGVMSPAIGLNASFAATRPRAGGLALVAQSGAVAAAALDWADARGYGFSRIITLGDMADVDFGDVLDALALDAQTRAVLLYVESITEARKFMSAARMAGRTKPVAVIKAGRSAAGAKAAMSHTGALAGADLVYDAAFRRAGLLRVYELRELFDAVTTLTSGIRVRGERLAIVTNGGGAGVMAVDSLEVRGGCLAELSPDTLAALNAFLPKAWSKGDPVDILGDATPERYRKAIETVLADPGADALLVLNCPTAVADSTDAARAVVDAVSARQPRPAVLTAWLGQTHAADGRVLFAQNGIPTHETPDEAARAFMHLADHARNQALLTEIPAAMPPADAAAAQGVVDKVLAEGRTLLTDPEAKAVLKAYGVEIAETLEAADPAEAGRIAEAIGGPVALKILSPDITHKSDVGGVMLGLSGPKDVEAAAAAMLERVKAAAPKARLAGFMVQAMAARPHARELLAGLSVDPTFGPVVLFGAGGTAVELLADRTIGLPPLNDHLARDMIGRTRIARLLGAYRDLPAADVAAVADTLIRLSRLAVDLPQVVELDINPLLADEHGVLALDARIRVTTAAEAARRRPAIAPYPQGLTEAIEIGGEALTVRPILPSDAQGLVDLVEKSAPEDVRLRFEGGMRHLPAALAGRLSQIDYDREMALVAVSPGGDILGVSRLAADPDGIEAEFALMVRTDRQHNGLGHVLLQRVVDYGRKRGLKRIWGQVARHNARMLAVSRDLGFRPEAAEDAAHVHMAIDLQPQAAPA
ncbi:MAG TPA: bifunctional acetate--CoA ligase family protein/GNAT family N-acetyltransferase [Caulobacteraceae bacterium]|nr:bifunctional acetate--CoA ligase family protein/GNAT family N-acetyltransferase [Caulobacteraceae bacterium]